MSLCERGRWRGPPCTIASIGGRPTVATTYGYGLMDSADPRHGRWLHHSGGLPGYGSHLLMLPDRGWGVFAFGNRTYAPMSRLTVRLADMLHEADPKRPVTTPSPALARAVEAFAAAYAEGRIEVAEAVFAGNF